MIYQLINGTMLYSETETRERDEWVFDARETCLVAAQEKGKHGGLVPLIQRMDKSPTKMSSLRVPVTSVVFRHKVLDKEWLAALHQELSGLVVVPGMRGVN